MNSSDNEKDSEMDKHTFDLPSGSKTSNLPSGSKTSNLSFGLEKPDNSCFLKLPEMDMLPSLFPPFEHNQTREDVTTVIINVSDGSSYDGIYQKTKIKSCRVYNFSAEDIKNVHHEILRCLQKDDQTNSDHTDEGDESEELKDSEKRSKKRQRNVHPFCVQKIKFLCQDIEKIGMSNVTINLDCCSGCSGNSYKVYQFLSPKNSKHVVDFLCFAIDQGCYVMAGDFSLKALISNWPEQWGECPLVNKSVMSGSILVRFGVDHSKKAPLGHLASVADMAIPIRKREEEKDEVNVGQIVNNAMGSTIVYEINDAIDMSEQPYTITVDTVCMGNTVVPAEVEDNGMYDDSDDDALPESKTILDLKIDELPLPIGPLKLKRQRAHCDFNKLVDPNQFKLPFDGQPNKPDLKRMNHSCPVGKTEKDPKKKSKGKRTIPKNDLTFGRFSREIKMHKCAGTKYLEGYPGHSTIRFKEKPGILIVSSLHFCELIDVHVSPEMLVLNAMKSLGPQESAGIEEELSSIHCPQLLRAKTSEIAHRVITATNPMNKDPTF